MIGTEIRCLMAEGCGWGVPAGVGAYILRLVNLPRYVDTLFRCSPVSASTYRGCNGPPVRRVIYRRLFPPRCGYRDSSSCILRSRPTLTLSILLWASGESSVGPWVCSTQSAWCFTRIDEDDTRQKPGPNWDHDFCAEFHPRLTLLSLCYTGLSGFGK